MSGMSQNDFEKLCRSIDETISKVANIFGNSISGAGNSMNDAFNQANPNRDTGEKIPTMSEIKAKVSAAAQNGIAKAKVNLQAPSNNDRYRQIVPQGRFRPITSLSVGGVLLTTFGGIFTFSFGISLIFMLALGFGGALPGTTLPGADIPTSVLITVDATLGVFSGLSIWGLAAGIGNLRLASQIKAFQRVFGNREVCSFKELASSLQTSEKKVIAAAKKMLKKGYLPQGHIDEAETCLMVTNEAYAYYQNAIATQKQRELEQKAQNRAKSIGKNGDAAITEEIRVFIENGKSYQAQLKDLDVAIDDEIISTYIHDIDNVIGRILVRVSEKPESIDCLDRLMDYYLPTTVKLLAAYDELEGETIQSENIKSSRLEIEQTLGNLKKAYEKLLDATYQDLSMNVSADISVLNAVLAQEGLTESPFDISSKKEDE